MKTVIMVDTTTRKVVSMEAKDLRAILSRANDWYKEHGEDTRLQELISLMRNMTLNRGGGEIPRTSEVYEKGK